MQHSQLSKVGLGLVGQIRVRPSKAKDGWYCHPVQLFHCYWSAGSLHNHRRQKLLSGWFLEGCGQRLGGARSHAFGGSHQPDYHSATGCLENRKEGLKIERQNFRLQHSIKVSSLPEESAAV